jgi:hypothetical protein
MTNKSSQRREKAPTIAQSLSGADDRFRGVLRPTRRVGGTESLDWQLNQK